jgi:hypothetical protein
MPANTPAGKKMRNGSRPKSPKEIRRLESRVIEAEKFDQIKLVL